MKKHLSTALLLLVLLAGVALLLYPTASDYWNSFHQSRAIAGYAESVSGLNAVDYEHIWRSAREYNARLLERANPFRVLEEDGFRAAAMDAVIAAYEKTLKLK